MSATKDRNTAVATRGGPDPKAKGGQTRAKGAPTPKRPSKARSGSAGAGVTRDPRSLRAAGARASAPDTALRSRLSRTIRVTGQWIGALIASLLHLTVLLLLSGLGLIVALPVYLVPALITLYMRPDSRRHWYRFAAPVAIAYVADSSWVLTSFMVVNAWVLRQCWTADRNPARDRSVFDALRAVFGRRPRGTT